MRAWLLTVGEPLPTDATSDRAWRAGMLARQVVECGHEVVWWSSAFDHARHKWRSQFDVPIPVGPQLAIWHLSGADYHRNTSVAQGVEGASNVVYRPGDLRGRREPVGFVGLGARPAERPAAWSGRTTRDMRDHAALNGGAGAL